MLSNIVSLVCFLVTSLPCDASLFGQSKICCDEVGCFNNHPNQAIPLPKCPNQMDIKMTLFTRNNRYNGQTINSRTIPSAFNGNDVTIFFVHGWLGGHNTDWLYKLKDEVLVGVGLFGRFPIVQSHCANQYMHKNYNAIVVGWDSGSKDLYYPQSTANTRTVGAYIGIVARNLIRNGGSDRSRLYCVGHSLGSHVCGYAGMTEKFGRITGLDPAGPLFEECDFTDGLTPDSADLVDVIHTNGQFGYLPNFGTMKIRGHVDFFPNGGGRQPGCKDGVLPNTITDLLNAGCSHGRSVDLFKESIRTQCFLATYHNCTDQYELPGTCVASEEAVQSMGFAADKFKARGIFYLRTSDKSPFCLH